jgi:hypothetical protein
MIAKINRLYQITHDERPDPQFAILIACALAALGLLFLRARLLPRWQRTHQMTARADGGCP